MSNKTTRRIFIVIGFLTVLNCFVAPFYLKDFRGVIYLYPFGMVLGAYWIWIAKEDWNKP